MKHTTWDLIWMAIIIARDKTVTAKKRARGVDLQMAHKLLQIENMLEDLLVEISLKQGEK